MRWITVGFLGIFLLTVCGCAGDRKQVADWTLSSEKHSDLAFSFYTPKNIRVNVKEVVDFTLYEVINPNTSDHILSLYSGNFPNKDHFRAIGVSPKKINLNGARGEEKVWNGDDGAQHREVLVAVNKKFGMYIHATYSLTDSESRRIADSIISSIEPIRPTFIGKKKRSSEESHLTSNDGTKSSSAIDSITMQPLKKPEFIMQVPEFLEIREEISFGRKDYSFIDSRTNTLMFDLFVSEQPMSSEFEMLRGARSRAIVLDGIHAKEKTWIESTGMRHRELLLSVDSKLGPHISISCALADDTLFSIADFMISSIRFR